MSTVPDKIILTASNPPQIRPFVRSEEITFYWSAPYDGGSPITSYTLTCLEDPTKDYTTPDGTLRSVTITGLTNGTLYTFSIYATNANGNGPPANYVTVQPGFRPNNPINVAASPIDNTTVDITWSPPTSLPVADIHWYVIKVYDPTNIVQKVSAHGTDRKKTIKGLNPSSTYQFSVHAVNDPGYSTGAFTNSISPLLVWLYGPDYTSGAWVDRSVYGRDATIENGTATKNVAGNGLVLNGSTNWIFPYIGSQSNFTLSVWFKQTGNAQTGGPAGGACIITEIFNGPINIFLYYPSSNSIFGGFYDGSFNLGTPYVMPYYTWKNIVITWDGINVKTYIDNSLNSTVDYTGSIASSTHSNSYRIGRRWDNAEYVTGEIGEVRIYQYPLSSDEISSNYSVGRPVFPVINIPLTATITALTNSSSNLKSSWTMNTPGGVNVQYYVAANSNGNSNVSTFGTLQSVASGTTSNTLSIQPTSGYYYYVTVAVGSNSISSSTTFMPNPVVSGVTLVGLNAMSSKLNSTWSMSRPYDANIQYYQCDNSSGSNTITFGPLLTALSGTTSNTYDPSSNSLSLVREEYYFVGVKPVGYTEVTSSKSPFPIPVASSAEIRPLLPYSLYLSSIWSMNYPFSTVLQYYEADDSNRTNSLIFSSNIYVGPGTTTNTYFSSLTIGKYYSFDVTPIGFSTISSVGTLVPYPVASNAQIRPLLPDSLYLSSIWAINYPFSTVLQYYEADNSNGTKSNFSSNIYVDPGISTNTYFSSLTQGKYYSLDVTPIGFSTISSVGTLMPYPTALSVTLNGLNPTSSNLDSSWTLNSTFSVNLQYYVCDDVNRLNHSTLGSVISIAAGTLSNHYDPSLESLTLSTGQYYYAGVTPTGFFETLGNVVKFPPPTNLGSLLYTYSTITNTPDITQELDISPGFALGSNDFTIDFWVYPQNSNFDGNDPGGGRNGNGRSGIGIMGVANPGAKNAAAIYIYHWSGFQFEVHGSLVHGWSLNNGSNISLNTWHHFAFARSTFNTGYIYALWLDGVRIQTPFSNITPTSATNYDNATTPTTMIGIYPNNDGYYMSGLLSDFRVVNGNAVYNYNNSNITVPTTNLDNVPGTVFLMEAKSEANKFVDTSGVQTITNSNSNIYWNYTSPFT